MADLVITIDGPAGSGKSTMARLLAERLGATFLDTGAMYRAVTLAAVRDGANLEDEQQLLDVVHRHRFDFEAADGKGPPNASVRVGEPKMLVRIDGQDVTELIRAPDLTAKVRPIAAAPRIREQLVTMQRAFAARHDKIVTEGRDQGTVVFPDARIKIFLTADPAERAQRRAAELAAKGAEVDMEQLRQAIEARDKSDENRAVGPLKPAQDAIRIDTTGSSIEESVERIYRCVEQRIGAPTPTRVDEKGHGYPARETSWHRHPADDPWAEKGPPTRDSALGTSSPCHDELASETPSKSDPPRQKTEPPAGQDRLHETLKVPRSPAAWYWVARFMCQVFTRIFFRYRAYGRENIPREGAFVLACNHQSFLDPVFCGIAVKRHVTYMARDTLFKNWFFGPLIASVNAIPISRDKPDIAVMRLVIDRLRQGAAVCLFPEGTRTEDGRITPFKPGFGLLCRRSKAAVVPVLIDGAFEAWPRHKKLFRPGSIAVQFGAPLQPGQIASMTNEQLADTVTQTLRQIQNEVRRNQGKPPYDYSVKFDV